MTREEIKPGVSIRNKKPYDGEGEYLIMGEINPETLHVPCVMACCDKYQALNGQRFELTVWAIEQFYEVVN